MFGAVQPQFGKNFAQHTGDQAVVETEDFSKRIGAGEGHGGSVSEENRGDSFLGMYAMKFLSITFIR